MSAASLSVLGRFFPFLSFRSSFGFVPEGAMAVEEELAPAGVDGRRFRTVHLQHTPVMVDTIAEAATYAAAVTLAENYRASKGHLASLSITAGGAAYHFQNVHIGAVDATVASGSVVGGGASSSSAAFVTCRWVLEQTEFPESDSA